MRQFAASLVVLLLVLRAIMLSPRVPERWRAVAEFAVQAILVALAVSAAAVVLAWVG